MLGRPEVNIAIQSSVVRHTLRCSVTTRSAVDPEQCGTMLLCHDDQMAMSPVTVGPMLCRPCGSTAVYVIVTRHTLPYAVPTMWQYSCLGQCHPSCHTLPYAVPTIWQYSCLGQCHPSYFALCCTDHVAVQLSRSLSPVILCPMLCRPCGSTAV